MLNAINRLRKRSPEERRRIAFWTAVLVTLSIALMWFISLVVGGLSPERGPSAAAGSPASGLWRELRQGTSAFIDSLKK